MTTYVLREESAPIIGSTGFVVGKTNTRIPLQPFPGLRVGAFVVAAVLVNQGEVNDDVSVEYEPVTLEHAKLLERQGWQIEEVS